MTHRPDNQVACIPEKEKGTAIIKLLHFSIKLELYFLILLLVPFSVAVVTGIVLAC